MGKEKMIIINGKRKTSIAKAKVTEGSGKVTINKVPYHLLNNFHKLSIEEPLRIARRNIKEMNFDIDVKVTGGGREGQIDAARLAVAKALVVRIKSPTLKKELEQYDRHLLVADVRRKEAYKPDDSKARAKR